MDKKQVLVSWSSGKDSAYTLYEMSRDPTVEVVGLWTTVNEKARRVAMHAVRENLLRRQGQELNLPLQVVPIPPRCTNEDYEKRVLEALQHAKDKGVTHIAFGDLALEDVKDYREQLIQPTGIEPLFPLWNRDTAETARSIIESGHKAIVTSVDCKRLSSDFTGKDFDFDFLQNLPDEIDPCGEYGEFHTFVYSSPLFAHPIDVKPNNVLERDGCLYLDLELA